jgi:hypothetical protein
MKKRKFRRVLVSLGVPAQRFNVSCIQYTSSGICDGGKRKKTDEMRGESEFK